MWHSVSLTHRRSLALRAAHLDEQYTVFGKVLAGDDVLAKLERVETRKEGIFVMPKTRITITKAEVSHIEAELQDHKEL